MNIAPGFVTVELVKEVEGPVSGFGFRVSVLGVRVESRVES